MNIQNLVQKTLKNLQFKKRKDSPTIAHGSKGIHDVGHRSYIGGLWDEVGSLQLDFLISRGLKPHHVLLDIACGSLRGGIHFISYLAEGNYLGIDKEEKLIQLGLTHELKEDIKLAKRPQFIISSKFEFSLFNKKPDYALAQSLFTHLTPDYINLCMYELRKVITDEGKFYATFFEAEKETSNPSKPHDHENFSYTREQMLEFGKNNNWKSIYIGDWKHPRGQVMVEYTPA